MRFIRRLLAMQTVRERARREQAENARALFEAEKRLMHTRQEIVLLRRRQSHLGQLVGSAT